MCTQSRVEIPAWIIEHCASLHAPLEPSPSFTQERLTLGSDRYAGTSPVLLRNAKIWTGARNGTEVVYGNVLLNRGIIQRLGYIPSEFLRAFEEGTSMAMRYMMRMDCGSPPDWWTCTRISGWLLLPILRVRVFLAESQSGLLTCVLCMQGRQTPTRITLPSHRGFAASTGLILMTWGTNLPLQVFDHGSSPSRKREQYR